MISKEFADLVKDLSTSLPSTFNRFTQGAGEEVQQAFERFLRRQGLVTRDEFEAQAKVLARLQEKVQQLEKKLTLLKHS